MAALGFAFDIYELLMMPLIAGPALAELLEVPLDSPRVTEWSGYIFWWSAMAGGFFGLLGGYLTDRFGRRRVLVWSILIYAFSALAAGFSTSAEMLLVLRCTTFIGVCVEFVAAVAWLAELFPEPRRREIVLGYTQAFSSVGGLLVTGASMLCGKLAQDLPPIYGEHSDWRYTLISGVIPALPLIVLRPFLPESPAWRAKKEAGTLRRPSILELFRPQYRRTTIVTTLMFAMSYGAAFGAIQLTPTRIAPGLPEVQPLWNQVVRLKKEQGEAEERLRSTAESSSGRAELEDKIRDLESKRFVLREDAQVIGKRLQFGQEVGGLLGRFVLAFLAVRIASRRNLLRVFQVPGLVIIPLVFLFPARNDLGLLYWGMFAAGFFTVAQFTFWGNYLPRVYPVHIRGTGEGFAANVGGRMIGTSAAFVTTQTSVFMPGSSTFEKVAYAAAAVALLVYAVGFAASFWLPEPAQEKLPE